MLRGSNVGCRDCTGHFLPFHLRQSWRHRQNSWTRSGVTGLWFPQQCAITADGHSERAGIALDLRTNVSGASGFSTAGSTPIWTRDENPASRSISWADVRARGGVWTTTRPASQVDNDNVVRHLSLSRVRLTALTQPARRGIPSYPAAPPCISARHSEHKRLAAVEHLTWAVANGTTTAPRQLPADDALFCCRHSTFLRTVTGMDEHILSALTPGAQAWFGEGATCLFRI